MKIETAKRTEYIILIEIWEASVRATHEFLAEADIVRLKPLILENYFDAVDLRCAKDEEGHIIGFIGVANDKIEMLFIAPEYRGRGIGEALTEYAIKYQGAITVDVNEQNIQAVGFYEHIGFKVISRSETDGQGMPYPLLHMKLENNLLNSGN